MSNQEKTSFEKFQEVQKRVDEKCEELRKINEAHLRWERDIDKIPKVNRQYAWRVRDWKRRMRKLEYRSIKPDDYHDWNLHKDSKR